MLRACAVDDAFNLQFHSGQYTMPSYIMQRELL